MNKDKYRDMDSVLEFLNMTADKFEKGNISSNMFLGRVDGVLEFSELQGLVDSMERQHLYEQGLQIMADKTRWFKEPEFVPHILGDEDGNDMTDYHDRD